MNWGFFNELNKFKGVEFYGLDENPTQKIRNCNRYLKKRKTVKQKIRHST